MAKRSVVALALAGVVFLVFGAAADAQVLRTKAFTTQFPDGWAKASTTNKTGASYTLASPATSVTPDGIPTPGGQAITIAAFSKTALERAEKRRTPKALTALARRLAQVPSGATGVKRGKARSTKRLARAPAASITLQYTLKGVANVQRDVVARRGNRIVVVEVDTMPGVPQARGAAAMRQVLSSWHWR